MVFDHLKWCPQFASHIVNTKASPIQQTTIQLTVLIAPKVRVVNATSLVSNHSASTGRALKPINDVTLIGIEGERWISEPIFKPLLMLLLLMLLLLLLVLIVAAVAAADAATASAIDTCTATATAIAANCSFLLTDPARRNARRD